MQCGPQCRLVAGTSTAQSLRAGHSLASPDIADTLLPRGAEAGPYSVLSKSRSDLARWRIAPSRHGRLRRTSRPCRASSGKGTVLFLELSRSCRWDRARTSSRRECEDRASAFLACREVSGRRHGARQLRILGALLRFGRSARSRRLPIRSRMRSSRRLKLWQTSSAEVDSCFFVGETRPSERAAKHSYYSTRRLTEGHEEAADVEGATQRPGGTIRFQRRCAIQSSESCSSTPFVTTSPSASRAPICHRRARASPTTRSCCKPSS